MLIPTPFPYTSLFVPIIAVFFGMVIRVFHSDHNPPHIHVEYGEYEAIVEIESGAIITGKLPRRLERLVKEWLKERRKDVMKAWQDAREHKMPHRVKPLE